MGEFRRFETAQEQKVRKLVERVGPSLAWATSQAHKAGYMPNAVMIPKHLDPGDYDGPDSTDTPAQMMGMEVIWGDRFALVINIGQIEDDATTDPLPVPARTSPEETQP